MDRNALAIESLGLSLCLREADRVSAGILVGNPGGIPEIVHIANALARSGALRAYVAPFSPVGAEVAAFGDWIPRKVREAIRSQLRRRALVPEVATAERYSVARAWEMAVVTGQRVGVPPSIQARMYAWRNRSFQHAVARLLLPDDDGVLVPSGAALLPLKRARTLGVRSWLDCPTAHHRYASRLLGEEVRLKPDFAATMQYPASSAGVARQLDEEMALATDLIVLSNFQARTFVEEGVEADRLHVLPLGVDVEMFRPAPPTRHEAFTIGFVGQVTQRKGISYLLDAFEALRPRGARLLVVGRPVGSRRPWLRAGVEHLPAMARWELPEIYQRMDVFVLPSLIEGFPQTALEAMACGVPVIVSENTFGTDVVVDGHDGYVVPIRDVDAIVDRLQGLINDESRRSAMGTHARATAERFTWEAFGRRVLDLVTDS